MHTYIQKDNLGSKSLIGHYYSIYNISQTVKDMINNAIANK